MMNEHFAKYLQQHRDAREAWRWVNANDDRVALDAMFLLNRMARIGKIGRETIYALKNQLVRNLYERGFCIACTLQDQIFECWHCDGTGKDPYAWDDEDNYCPKCGGTGIYRSYRLYQFVFRVCGKTYVWHQPERYVDWPITLTDSAVGRFNEKNEKGQIDTLLYSLMFLYGAVVRAYLLKHGVSKGEVPHLYGLRHVARDMFLDRWQYSRAQFKWKRLRRRGEAVHKNARRLWVFLTTGEMPAESIDFPF